MLKSLLTILIFLIFTVGCVPTLSYEPSHYKYTKTRHYDNKGKYQGHSIETNYGTIRHYDKNGRFIGTSKKVK